ncbi:DNA primase [Caprobacter fermentans]|uniref:DNA primase n=1 Tax=Caproicibacter fermentans TaxID=2576756 RepID=A0A6N8I4Y4_9FIRM|nr:DNA primase [Caproicibacter fermentans]MVB13025.1 DNA primase [Caproicibacter fermentans]
MPLPESFLQELKARCDLAEIAANYVSLKRSGRNLVGLCPFHSEKSPSFNIYPENGSFYCFGCGTGGDVITFIRRIENLDYMEAVRFLAQRAGLQVPEAQVDDGMAKLRARILEINRETARFFYSVLNSDAGREGREYFNRRELKPETVRHFGLGYSPASRFALVDMLEKKGYTQNEMILANVAFKSRSGRAVDRFFGRVMFPIIDLRGNVVAFGGRTLGDDKPKYLNTSETPVFNKGNLLFALNFAKNCNSERLILCEGYMDVIALHQAGFQEAVATLGTSLTAPQARLMARYAKEIVVCYDSDEPGQKAASRAIPILRDAGLVVRVLTVTGGKDPDEYIKTNGPIKFKQLLDACGNDVEYRLQKAKQGRNLQIPEQRVEYLNAAASVLATLENRIEQEVYAGRLAQEAGIATATVMNQISAYSKRNRKKQMKKQFQAVQQQAAGLRDRVNPEKAGNLRAAVAEEALIAHLLKFPESSEKIAAILPPEKFITSFNRRVYAIIVGRITKGNAVGLADLSEEFTMDEISSVSRILAAQDGITLTWPDVLKYINIISQENDKLTISRADSVRAEEIEDYLQKLRQQKK